MVKIIKESFQNVDDYLRSQDLKNLLIDEFPDIKSGYNLDESEINQFIIESVNSNYDEPLTPKEVQVVVLKVLGESVEIVTANHYVIEFNGFYYDFTAHQFKEEFNDLIDFKVIPVFQPVITSDAQLSERVSTVKSYALIKY